MTQGHLYIAFDQEYDTLAAASVLNLRKFSQLPVCVLTNLSFDLRDDNWDDIKNVTFTEIPDKHNRDIKTRMIDFTPFDETLYTDTDTLILSEQFMLVFDVLKFFDLAFPCHNIDESVRKFSSAAFKQAVIDFKIKLPALIYQGGVCVFKKNKQSKNFFNRWNSYWNVRKFRDMPPLVAAVQQSNNVNIGILPETIGFPDSKILQHFYGYRPPVTNKLPQIIKQWANETSNSWVPRTMFR